MSANTGVIATAEVTAVVGDRSKKERERFYDFMIRLSTHLQVNINITESTNIPFLRRS